MTTAGVGSGDVVAPAPRRSIGWPVVVHAGMLGAMALAMWPGARAADRLGAIALLVVLSLVVAPFARSRGPLIAALVDLAAMGAMILAMIGETPGSGGHAHGGGTTGVAAVAVLAAWALARMPLSRSASERVLAGASGLSLVAMALLDLPR